jgi:hypothetical protein
VGAGHVPSTNLVGDDADDCDDDQRNNKCGKPAKNGSIHHPSLSMIWPIVDLAAEPSLNQRTTIRDCGIVEILGHARRQGHVNALCRLIAPQPGVTDRRRTNKMAGPPASPHVWEDPRLALVGRDAPRTKAQPPHRGRSG